MSSHPLNNCGFILKDISFIEKQKLELILLSYNIGWGSTKHTHTISKELLRCAEYIWVKDSIIWQSETPYEPYSKLPLLDVKNIINTY